MEAIKATVENSDEKYFIKIESGDEQIRIPMSEDKPNDVKSAFNKLIARIKDGEFQIELEKPSDDLFSQVAIEYILQLNREIQEVYREMEHYNLLKE
ncbi:hypothetical protein [Gimesia maris]|uniref:hypothetical protein n=1 Tax=Gimesia maris TaxID=122 RepID=UPI00241FD50F|nr:hypothetical protein [Gimesia maris]|tara:strand:+ start:4844 stop:5134 length:291 start_codon:yes stop_codon:yes gene_type:complete